MSVYFDETKLREDLGRRSLRSGAISMGARAVIAVAQIGPLLVLARLLTPEDYGLVAMVAALTGFAPALVDFGTRDAVVQRAGVTEGEVSALFWFNALVGCAFALAVSASGPVIAAFYGEPRLAAIALVSSLTFVLLALAAQHQALLRRAVMFRQIATIDVAANVASAVVAVAMAYSGFGYWALVVRPVAMASVTAAGSWWYSGWRPRRPVVTRGVKEMVAFGLNLSGFVLTDFVGRNSDRVAVGRGLGVRTLGYYQNALLAYDNILDIFVFSLHQVAVSALSKLHGDLVELRRTWSKALGTVAFFAMPAFGILAITSEDVIVLVLGEKWAMAGALLSVLALRGIPHSTERTLGWLHVAAGRTDRWFRWGILATCIQLVAVLCGLPFGAFGIVWAHVISMYLLFVPALVYAGRPLGIRSREVIAAIGVQLTGSLISAGVGFAARTWLLRGASSIERTAVLVLLYLAVYLAVVVGLFRMTEPISVCLSLMKDVLPGPLKRMVTGHPPEAPE